MRSYIELDGRPYNIYPKGYRKVLANPMAAKTSQGSSKFTDQQNWDYFIQDDWSGGVGKEDSSGGGSAFSVGDTRWSGRYSSAVPIYSDHVYTGTQLGYYPTRGQIAVGSTGTYQKLLLGIGSDPADITGCVLAMSVETPSADTTISATLYELSATCEPTGAALWTANKTIYAENLPGLQTVEIPLDWTTSLGTTNVCVVVECASNITLSITQQRVYTSYSNKGSWQAYWDGSTWQKTFVYACAHTSPVSDYAHYEDANWVRNTNVNGSGWITNYDGSIASPSNWTIGASNLTPAGYTNPATEALFYDDLIYVAYGASHNMISTPVSMSATGMGVKADRIDIGGGYLWRCYSGSVYYSADLSTWTEVMIGETIFDIKWYNGAPHFVTTVGLYKLGSGDVPLILTRSSFSSSTTMSLWQGRLYISDGSQLIEFDGSSMRDISPMSTGSGGLPPKYTGDITAILVSNIFLYAAITAEDTTSGRSGIYAYNGNGWSCLHLFGSPVEIHSMRTLTIADNRFIIGILTSIGMYSGYVPENSGATSSGFPFYATTGWIETPWIYGGLHTLEKDWESVFLSFDQPDSEFTTSWNTTVYYKTSSEDSSWTLLGENSFEEETGSVEFRFPLTARPASDRIKIGVTQEFTYTSPRGKYNIRMSAMRVKYHAMVADRWQWGLSIPVEDDQELLDGSTNPYSRREMRAHLDELIRQTPPFIFTDIDGSRYEVKVLSGNENVDEVWGMEGATPKLTTVYNLTMEMVTTSEYTG